jgi:sugar phosphate isomerase/epimerase
MTGVHPLISVSQMSSWGWSLDEDLAFYEQEGIGSVGIALRKLAATGDPMAAVERVRSTGLRVTNLLARAPFTLDHPEHWPSQREAASVIMDVALALRPEVVVLTTGPAGGMPWERAADAFAAALQGMATEADREGLLLAIEPTHSLRRDTSFVHSLRDALELGFRTDMAVCCELNQCWTERNLSGNLTAGIDAVALVQVSDWSVGTHCTPDRRVPGDGDMPLAQLVPMVLDAGYTGMFDIEVLGPRIDEEGYASAIRRSIAWLTECLERYEAGPEDDDDGEDDGGGAATGDEQGAPRPEERDPPTR